jgi:hypothetical protein
MKIDQTHRSWLFASIVILIVATVVYIPYSLYNPGGPSGNSVVGLLYGIVGYSMMLFAGLLGARKKVPLWRIGRAKVWMRGHLWLGALSLPIILFHSGFQARGPLTLLLIVLLTIVVLSGISGALLQHFLPRRMMSDVQAETVYEEIPHVREQLTAEAGAIVEKLCVDPASVTAAATSFETGRVAVLTADEDDPGAELSDTDRARLHKVYNDSIFPFLRDPEGDSPLASQVKSATFFEALRRQSPPSIHADITNIESICEEQRQLTRQRRMHMVLHGWLLVHVPVSITLLVLGGIHALVAIRY